MIRVAAGIAACLLSGCTQTLFSGVPQPDHSNPVMLVETTGGVEYAAGTDAGVLFLGRTATEGPCAVHYLLGPTPMVDDGVIEPAGGVFRRAAIDLRVPFAHLLPRPLRTDDDIRAMWLEGYTVQSVPVRLARGDGLEGDLLEWPGQSLPAGAGLFVPTSGNHWAFAGLVSGEATLEQPRSTRRLLTFAGYDRLRDMLATPRSHLRTPEIKYRRDNIQIVRDPKR